MSKDTINTGLKFFGKRILIESTGDSEVDKAMKSLFKDDYRRTAPLEMTRKDSRIVMKWLNKAGATAKEKE